MRQSAAVGPVSKEMVKVRHGRRRSGGEENKMTTANAGQVRRSRSDVDIWHQLQLSRDPILEKNWDQFFSRIGSQDQFFLSRDVLGEITKCRLRV